MSAPIVSAQDCCSPCDSVPITQVPGPAGAAGAAGSNGTNGANAFTLTTAGFTQPAVAATVSVAVASSAWAVIGQVVYVQNAGYYTVNAIADSTHLTLANLGYAGNAAPAAVIGAGQRVGPGGLKGVDGSAGSGTLNSLSPTTTRGDALIDNGANSPAASLVRFPVGADGTRPQADSTQPTGLLYSKVDLADTTEVTGVLAAANGGNSNRLPLAGGTLTGNLIVSLGLPIIRLNNTAGAADAKRWDIEADANRFDIIAVDDAGGVFNLAFSINRTGATPTRLDAYYDLHMAGAAKVDTFLDYKQDINAALVNGNNNNVAAPSRGFLKIKAGPSAAFAITGIAGGVDGRVLVLYNATGQNMTLSNEDVLSTASNRIVSTTGASIVTTGDGTAILIYDIDAQRWLIVSSTA